MNFTPFQNKLFRNYLIGSFIAVMIVGTTFISHTLIVPKKDLGILLGVLFFSLICMLISESILYKKHVRPIKNVLDLDVASLEEFKKAYLTTLRFPVLSLKRILLPHFLGLAIPASLLTMFFINQQIITIPIYYVVFAWIGAFLIAFTHAIIEFLLTSKAIIPVLKTLRKKTLAIYQVDLNVENYVLLSIKRKFFFSILFIGIFPVLLFSLATFIYLIQLDRAIIYEYWQWAAAIMLIVGITSIYFSTLLTKEVEEPINHLQQGMKSVQNGLLPKIDEHYTDEFSKLMAGFNHMSDSLREKEQLNTKLLNSFYTVFSATLDARDHYTAGHSIRVANYAVEIGKYTGLSPSQLDLLHKSALLHDIGKIGIRDEVLLKEGKLTDEEFAQIKLHPSIGADILTQIQPKEAMVELIPGVKYHHERYDGKGYPDGLAGENIPFFGRILAVADAFDAMTSNRPYRKGMSTAKALSIIDEGKGTQWDPVYAKLFVELMREKQQEENGKQYAVK
ncbi:HD-GYP domain-containing protein [Aquibacillus kalidii]|uniref:HD-GYP domain-containing protein n=1 Tax=Aquibacillus kalidii TaxID=2762597 RepID=UPI001647FFC6|nr:HD-GYP domain-containing protein [Aquibacillus kalidii]